MRLVEVVGDEVTASVKIRRIRGWLALCAAIALIPWTIYLGLTLPQSYSAQHWQATWVGFDVLLLVFMFVTAVLGFTHHRLLTLFAFTTGVLLCATPGLTC